MPKERKLIGHVQCPDCDHPDAEILLDKNEHPYRWCPECNAQTFTRGDKKRVENMKRRMRPVTPPAPPPPGTSPAAPPPKPAAPSGPASGAADLKKKFTLMG